MVALSGAVSQTCTSLPFGDGLNCTGTEWNFNHFTDDVHDGETNLEHTLYRKYAGFQGRWTTPDPYLGSMDFTNPQSLNRYAYVLDDPINWIDPLGFGNQKGAEGPPAPPQLCYSGGVLVDWSLCQLAIDSALAQLTGALGNAIANAPAIVNGIRKFLCNKIIPQGRVQGVSGALGILLGVTGSAETVVNYNNGGVYNYFSGGFGVDNGAASLSVQGGLIYQNGTFAASNYSGGFTTAAVNIPTDIPFVSGGAYVSKSSGGYASPTPTPNGVTVRGLSVGASLVSQPITLSATNYSQPVSVGTIANNPSANPLTGLFDATMTLVRTSACAF